MMSGFRSFLDRIVHKGRNRAPVSPESDPRTLAARARQEEARRLASKGRWESAIDRLDQAIDLDPRCGTAWYDKARYLAALGRLEEAVDCYGQAPSIDPKMAGAWFSKALAEEKLDRTQDAIRSYERYIAAAPPEDAEQIAYARRCLRDLGGGEGQAQDPVAPEPGPPVPSPQPLPERPAGGDRVAEASPPPAPTPSTPAPRPASPPPASASQPASAAAKGRQGKEGSLEGLAGERIGEFIVGGVLGRGGFGVVYLVYLPTYLDIASLETFRAEDLPTRGRPSDRYVTYALKTMHDPYLAVPQARQRFRREAQLLVELERHPHLLQADFVDEIAGRLYIATEYIAPGPAGLNSLEGYLAHRPPDLAQSLRWGIQVCYGMEHARSKGLRCHRDLKPANLLITQDLKIKIADFGLAGVLDAVPLADGIQVQVEDGRVGLSAQTLEGAGFGTPTHMPPEQFTHAASCDERSDIYAFGVILYQMAAGGRLPFLAAPPRDPSLAERRRFWSEMYRLHRTAPVPRLDTPLRPIIERCLAKEPARRYQSFEELRHELEPLLREETGEVPQAPAAGELTAGEWHIKGYSLAALGRWAQAIACYDRALALAPDHAATWTNKGRSLGELGRHGEALACYDRALALNPQFADGWNNKGTTLTALGKRPQALECFDRALSLNPRFAQAWNNKAVALQDLGRYPEAIACLDRALDLAPEDAMTWNNKGILLGRLGRREEALACFDRALSLNPRLAQAWSAKAENLAYLGRRGEAIACCDRALALDPQLVVAWNNKGANLAALGRREEAIACYDRVLALDPRDAVVWNNKANNLAALGRVEEAMGFYEKAVALDPKYAHAWFNKALHEDQLGRRHEARRSYERFLAVAPPQELRQILHAQQRLRALK